MRIAAKLLYVICSPCFCLTDPKSEVIFYDEDDKRLKFVGTLKSNSRAFGTLFMKNKEIYRGHLQDGLKEGEGTYFWPNGDKYEGNFENDMKSGTGITNIVPIYQKANL